MYVSKVLQISETNGTLSVWTSVMLVPQGTVLRTSAYRAAV